MIKRLAFRLLALAILAPISPLIAQQAAAPAPPVSYVLISYNQVDWRRVDSLRSLIRTYRLPQVEEAKKAGSLLEDRFLFHLYGTEWNLVRIRKFRTWAALEADTSMAAALRRTVPDSTRRAAIAAGFAWAYDGNAHRDEIFTEVVR